MIARGRSGAYIEAATRSVPQAIQVADRWHLLHNLSDALERFFLQKWQLLKQAAHAVTAQQQPATDARPAPDSRATGRTRATEVARLQRHAAFVELYHQIHALRAKRVDITNIARHVGVSREPVYRYLRMPEPPLRKQPLVRRATQLDSYKPYPIT